jgi:hypothetical protein
MKYGLNTALTRCQLTNVNCMQRQNTNHFFAVTVTIPRSRITGQFRKESTRYFPDDFRLEYCFHVPAIFCVFLQNTVTFPRLFYRIRWPESSIWARGRKYVDSKHPIHRYLNELYSKKPLKRMYLH